MPGIDFRLPGYREPLASPENYLTGLLRNFGNAAQALGAATSRLVLRLAADDGHAPSYQIQTLDGEDAVAYSGDSHEPLYDDITRRFEEDELQDQTYGEEQVKDWLNVVNGEGAGGGSINPILSTEWEERDPSDPRD